MNLWKIIFVDIQKIGSGYIIDGNGHVDVMEIKLKLHQKIFLNKTRVCRGNFTCPFGFYLVMIL